MPNGAAVYSLVRKEKYWGKLTDENFNVASDQPTKDFKFEEAKPLICSAMACGRDLVKTQNFFKKNTQFHGVVGASVRIITYTLRNLIDAEQLVRDSQI